MEYWLWQIEGPAAGREQTLVLRRAGQLPATDDSQHQGRMAGRGSRQVDQDLHHDHHSAKQVFVAEVHDQMPVLLAKKSYKSRG